MISNTIAVTAVRGVAALTAPRVLPSSTVVERCRRIPASAADIFALLSSGAGVQAFSPFCDDEPDLKIDLFGPERKAATASRYWG